MKRINVLRLLFATRGGIRYFYIVILRRNFITWISPVKISCNFTRTYAIFPANIENNHMKFFQWQDLSSLPERKRFVHLIWMLLSLQANKHSARIDFYFVSSGCCLLPGDTESLEAKEFTTAWLKVTWSIGGILERTAGNLIAIAALDVPIRSASQQHLFQNR